MVLKYFERKNLTNEIVTINKDFELYQVFMYDFLCQTVLIFLYIHTYIYIYYILYIIYTYIYVYYSQMNETFWSRDITNVPVLAYFKLKMYKDF